MKYLLLIFLLFLSQNAFSKVMFGKECESQIIELINNSNKSINVAVYSINNLNIIEALLDAKNRGVEIKILTDRIQASGKSSKVNFLHEEGFDVKIHSKDRIMHHKFAIFDNEKAIKGSFNWTYSAANKNSEDCDLVENENDIYTLYERFLYLWDVNLKNLSECYFENMYLEKNQKLKCK